MTNIALFPGAFDPVTYGHLDLIERASKLYSEVIVAVAADTYGKTTMLDLATRKALLVEATKQFPTIRVIDFQGLTVDCATKHHANVIIRGLRSPADFEYEHRMAAVNHTLAPKIETVFLATSPQYAAISATLVRQIASLKGDITPFVPPHVAAALLGSK